MPVTVDASSKASLVEVQLLKQNAFAAFGTVIENPEPAREPSAQNSRLPPNAVHANQGTALKYQDVTTMVDLYASAPSKVASKAVMNMFVCGPRDLSYEEGTDGSLDETFPVEILERHPFTTQTFIPLGLSTAEQQSTRYLVIVAPSIAASRSDEQLPVLSPDSLISNSLPVRGLPDVGGLQAFIANGTQAVTYGAGIWHAPMVVVGVKPVEFVVVQFSNGVEFEDCQEAVLKYPNSQPTIRVSLRHLGLGRNRGEVAKL